MLTFQSRRAARQLAYVIAVSSSPAWACTLCHSRTAEQVRAAVFGPDFWGNAAAVALPLPVLIAAVLAARRLAA